MIRLDPRGSFGESRRPILTATIFAVVPPLFGAALAGCALRPLFEARRSAEVPIGGVVSPDNREDYLISQRADTLDLGLIPCGGIRSKEWEIEIDSDAVSELEFTTSCSCVRATVLGVSPGRQERKRVTIRVTADFTDDVLFEGGLVVLVEARDRNGVPLASLRVLMEVVGRTTGPTGS